MTVSVTLSTVNGPTHHREAGQKVLTSKSINAAVKKAEYAVRGEIALKAEELKQKIEMGEGLAFDQVVNCNIGMFPLPRTVPRIPFTAHDFHFHAQPGNPQQLGQKGITFFRQVRSLFCSWADRSVHMR
jgi:alanine transaminase